jgi:ArsR family transcriptional regulator, arsenate/arsenite/antimonite-responsive transcriptional repressor
MLKALAHPVRLKITYLLALQGESVCVCDIEPHFDIKQPTISHHLKILREAGIVDVEQRGLFAHYRVQKDALAFLKHEFTALAR